MTALRNVAAILEKEWRHYFGSPIAYVAICMWTLLFGFFYNFAVEFFLRQSMMMSQQMEMGGGPKLSMNEYPIRPVLQNMAVVALFILRSSEPTRRRRPSSSNSRNSSSFDWK